MSKYLADPGKARGWSTNSLVFNQLEYYIVNRGDERKWNKQTESSVPQTSSHPSWDVLSSEVQCRLNMEGSGAFSTESRGSTS